MGKGIQDMTPFALELYQSVDDAKLKMALTTAVCFDFTEVLELLQEISKQFPDSSEQRHHGDLAVYPADIFLLEFRTSAFKLCVLCVVDKRNDLWFNAYSRIPGDKVAKQHRFETGRLYLDWPEYGNFYSLIATEESKFTSKPEFTKADKLFGLYIISALTILNAPYGIKRETPPRHKGHVREAKRKGYELLPHHIITLDKSAPPKEYAVTGAGGSPKAFHFVRAHRRLVSWTEQRYTTVKAHWRGDPRLGIHRASYRVR
jgi:hypothetical protein